MYSDKPRGSTIDVITMYVQVCNMSCIPGWQRYLCSKHFCLLYNVMLYSVVCIPCMFVCIYINLLIVPWLLCVQLGHGAALWWSPAAATSRSVGYMLIVRCLYMHCMFIVIARFADTTAVTFCNSEQEKALINIWFPSVVQCRDFFLALLKMLKISHTMRFSLDPWCDCLWSGSWSPSSHSCFL